MIQEEKLKEAKRLYETANADQRYVLESLFPELKEDENDRIRRAIIEHFVGSHSCMFPYKGFTKEQIIDWLDKQGEQKPIEMEEFTSIPFGAYDSELVNETITIPDGCVATIEGRKVCIKKEGKGVLEVVKEEKVNNADKVESKFKVGDWVVRTNGENFRNGSKFAQIQSIALYGEMCYLDTGRWLYPSELRLWTINDAEPGDVLICPKYAGDVIPNIFIFKNIDINNDVLCYCSLLKIFFATEGYVASADPIDTDFYPANKEQYDLLFKKMKESGYKWNVDKKELKKLN